MVDQLLDLAHSWQRGGARAGAGSQLLAPLRARGCRLLVARVYPGHLPERGSRVLWQAGGFIEALEPEGWQHSAERDYICLDNNPLIAAPQRGLRRFSFSDLAPRGTPGGDRYWEAWSRAGVCEGLGLLCYPRDGRTASLSLGFEHADWGSPRERQAVVLVGHALLEALLESGHGLGSLPRLTAREQEVMRLIARGLTDRDVAALLAVRPTTVRTHAENAFAKLDAANRKEAVAAFVSLGQMTSART
jgi:DNA-binding CsgD family transcriptional regulator